MIILWREQSQKKVHLRPVSPHLGLISQARHSVVKMNRDEKMSHAKLHWHSCCHTISTQSPPQLISIGYCCDPKMSPKLPDTLCLEIGCAQFPRRSASCSCLYLGNVTERVGNITISKNCAVLVRWAKQCIIITKNEPSISGEIVTRYPTIYTNSNS